MTEKINFDELQIDPSTIPPGSCEKTRTGDCGGCPICEDEAAEIRRENDYEEEFGPIIYNQRASESTPGECRKCGEETDDDEGQSLCDGCQGMLEKEESKD